MLTHADDLQKSTDFLAAIDSDWAQLIATVGPCTFEAKSAREPYEALVRAVAYQQLHPKAGDAILRKLIQHVGQSNIFPQAQQIIHAAFDELRACGFSGRKIETLKGIAEATLNGLVPARIEANAMTNEALIERLVSLKGIGQWTVEMMLMFTLARMDILPANDLGIALGYQRLKKLQAPPKPMEIAEIAKAWSPYRSIASWYLWRVPK